ncbi:hypothetical protein A1O3_03414 [Capronia epimyces CBS 606.96]|uniref:Wings apart-like protein C-terminal domain-containing protein n=1 Tax=Capronia epimyces CBS 606.96 TaxID=1182542 RepID=W9Y1V3_9EURO|nr:uncharacterized protein A1O3_03414 [Capronia epimyces CBS 606.96]EXJ86463.1 hypothetical protein A1O3_03414 [Capronia epimyces CBS 606.96]
MDVPGTRRRPNTYGKGGRKIQVHDIFDFGGQSSYQSTTAVSSLRGPGQPEQPDPPLTHAEISRPGIESMASNATSYSRRDQIGGKLATSLSAKTSSHSPSKSISPSSLFEIQTSDEESSTPKAKRPLKKRKVVFAVTDSPAEANVTKAGKASVPGSYSDGHNLKMKVPRKQMGSEAIGKGASQPLDNAVTKADSRPRKQAPKTTKPNTKQPTDQEERRRRTRPVSPDLLPPTKPAAHKPFRVSSESSTHISDSSESPASSRHSTPKRRRVALDEGTTDSPSPSDLQMTSLRLASEKFRQDLQISSDDEEMIDARRTTRLPPRSRKRLVDRLDAPAARNVGGMASNGPSHLGNPSKQPFSHPVSGTTSPGKTGAAPSSLRADTGPVNTSNTAAPGRPRATYAKQRSYLSDMVDSLENQPGSLSQPSSQPDYLSQMSFTTLDSQVDLVHQDSDDDDFTQIKSIHELRRGGAIRKFDLDLHTIVEDVEAKSRSLRIQALIQLNRKLEDLSLCRHFQDSNTFVRFLGCAHSGLDDVSATLMAVVFQKMSTAEFSSPKTGLQILGALDRLPLHLLSESRSLSKLAKDRNQNLSKLLLRDVAHFTEQIVDDDGPPCMSVNTVFLRAIDGVLRSLIKLKEPLPRLPRPLLDGILGALTNTEEDMQARSGRDSQADATQLLLAILEMACANQELLGSSLSNSRISELGDRIAGILIESRDAQPLMEQSCLRLIVTLSNNEPKVCNGLTNGRLIDTVFQVIEDRFSTLAGLAAREEAFDPAQLDSAILAVGCLLNLAECAEAAREQMLEPGAGGKSLVDRLVGMFNGHVDQTSEAMTMPQTHVLVAFGYISALLCTLCLNAHARKRISDSIVGEGLAELFGQAATFLNHLQTVEAALADNGGSASGFTARFTAVLESVEREAI